MVYGLSNPDWFYGMTIIGDPTLKPHNNMTEARPPVASRPLQSDAELTPEVVCPHPETDDSPQLVADADTVWAVWKTRRNTNNGRFDIYAACRDYRSWSGAWNIGSAYYWETDPCFGLDRTVRPVAVWSVFTDEYHYNLYWSAWTGSGWTTARQVCEDSSSDMQANLCRDSTGTLWCLFLSRPNLWADIWPTSFNGSSWTTPVNITRDTATELNPRAATMPDGTVWVVYSKYINGESRVYARYHSAGDWVETGPASGNQRRALRPAITYPNWDSSAPVVVWHGFDSGSGDIWSSV